MIGYEYFNTPALHYSNLFITSINDKVQIHRGCVAGQLGDNIRYQFGIRPDLQ